MRRRIDLVGHSPPVPMWDNLWTLNPFLCHPTPTLLSMTLSTLSLSSLLSLLLSSLWLSSLLPLLLSSLLSSLLAAKASQHALQALRSSCRRGRSAHAKCRCALGSHMRHVRGRLQLLVSRAKGCVVGLLAASNRLQAICWVQ